MTADVDLLAARTVEPDLRSLWVGVDAEVPLPRGRRIAYANFDNAASTPPLRVVRDQVDTFLEWYASVHRGAGYKSRLSTDAYEEARRVVAGFVRADPVMDRVVFTKHTTESLNLLASVFPFGPGDGVAVSVLEHHSNQLPYRRRATVHYVEADAAGRLDLDSLDSVLARAGGSIRLVALTAASNVTGFVSPIHEAARIAHRHGALIAVDAAQLVAHRPIDMLPHDDPGHLDIVAFSGHKIYAPYGSGVLVAPARILDDAEPMLAGGGAVRVVTRDDVAWEDAPDRDEAGSPNVVGAVALAVALDAVERLGFDVLEEAENRLTHKALQGLTRIPGLRVLGSADPDSLADRLGVVTFTIDGLHHSLVAAILANEWGIGVRNGCFCAHPYLMELLGLSDAEMSSTRARLIAGDRSDIPGAARASFAPYNRPEEVDRLVEAIGAITSRRIELRYAQDRRTGDYEPVDWSPGWARTFSLRGQGV
jgi:selenocysteine lyase/cysteine desulfurase